MSRSVLLVDADVDALGELASELRNRGLTVALADSAASAIASVDKKRPDAVLVAKPLEDAVKSALTKNRALADLPCLAIATEDEDDPASERLPKTNADLIATRIYALRVAAPPVVAQRGDFRGDLRQVPVPDLLQLLSMNRRTGVLSITTPSGAGEVRLADGEVVDAVYRRLEGEKALYRLLAEGEGTFAFASGVASPMRRVEVSTNMLLMEGMRQLDEVRERRAKLGDADDALLIVAPPGEDAPDVKRRVAELLTAPRTVDELLDDVPLPDLDILRALEEMIESGAVRRVARGAVHAELAESERLTVLGALIRRLNRPGFLGAPRLVLAASPQRLGTVAHAVRRIANAIAPAESIPAAPVPHLLATLRLADTDLDVIGLPAIDAYSPMWSLTLPGAVAAIRLPGVESATFEQACSVSEVPMVDADSLLGDIDEADPAQMAALISGALQAFAAA